MKKVCLIIIFIVGFLPLNAQNIKGKADKQKYMVGDYIHYEFSIPKTNKNVTISSNFQFSDTLQIIDSKVDTSNKDVKYSFTFASFIEGKVHLPEFQFYEPNQTNPVINVSSVEVDIVLPSIDTTKIEVKPLKSIIKIPYTFKEIAMVVVPIIVLAAIIILIIYFIKKFKRRTIELPIDTKALIPEDVEALENIDKLKQAHLIENSRVKQHYILLSEILWRYIYRRYDVNAFEMTSTQIIETLQTKDVPVQSKEELDGIFSVCDLVKFAKYIPDSRTNTQLLDHSVDFINTTKKIESEVVDA